MTLCTFFSFSYQHLKSSLLYVQYDNKSSLSDSLINTSRSHDDALALGEAETSLVNLSINDFLCVARLALALSQQIPQLAVGFCLFAAHSSRLALPQEFSPSDYRSNYTSSRTPTPPGGYSPHSPIDRDVPMSPRRRYTPTSAPPPSAHCDNR